MRSQVPRDLSLCSYCYVYSMQRNCSSDVERRWGPIRLIPAQVGLWYLGTQYTLCLPLSQGWSQDVELYMAVVWAVTTCEHATAVSDTDGECLLAMPGKSRFAASLTCKNTSQVAEVVLGHLQLVTCLGFIHPCDCIILVSHSNSFHSFYQHELRALVFWSLLTAAHSWSRAGPS